MAHFLIVLSNYSTLKLLMMHPHWLNLITWIETFNHSSLFRVFIDFSTYFAVGNSLIQIVKLQTAKLISDRNPDDQLEYWWRLLLCFKWANPGLFLFIGLCLLSRNFFYPWRIFFIDWFKTSFQISGSWTSGRCWSNPISRPWSGSSPSPLPIRTTRTSLTTTTIATRWKLIKIISMEFHRFLCSIKRFSMMPFHFSTFIWDQSQAGGTDDSCLKSTLSPVWPDCNCVVSIWPFSAMKIYQWAENLTQNQINLKFIAKDF